MEDQKILTDEKLPVNLCRLSNFVLRFQLEIVDSRRLQVKMGQKGKVGQQSSQARREKERVTGSWRLERARLKS